MEKKIIFKYPDDLIIEDGRIIFRNFSGKESRFNPSGVRNFCVIIDNELAEVLKGDGWRIRYLKPRDEDEAPQAYMQVAVNYAIRPPRIYMVSKKKKTLMDEESVNALDWAELEKVDMVIHPRVWDDAGTKKVKAYCKTLYATIKEDPFEGKYDDPDEEIPF